MKHLKKFEFYLYDRQDGMEEPEETLIPPFNSEEEEEDITVPPTDMHSHDGFEGEEEEMHDSDLLDEEEEGGHPGFLYKWNNEDEDEVSVRRIKSFEAVTGNLSEKKAKPDFIDLDKDGDKKESMKKAAADKKKGEVKKDSKKETPKKGGKLTKSQEKLPPALKKAIASGVRD